VESPAFRKSLQSLSRCFASGNRIRLNGRHPSTNKGFSFEIRSGNPADTFIFWEFISGNFYPPPAKAEHVIDCGSNIGFFALHAKILFPQATLVCYEPDAGNFEMLQRNLLLNGIDADCRRCGVWSTAMNGFFHPMNSFDGHVSMEPSAFPVACELPRILDHTWLKIDVEGAEYEVLPSVLDTGKPPLCISIEVHDQGYHLDVVTDNSPKPAFAEITARLHPENRFNQSGPVGIGP
jgi:FkbM family methyltransferase